MRTAKHNVNFQDIKKGRPKNSKPSEQVVVNPDTDTTEIQITESLEEHSLPNFQPSKTVKTIKIPIGYPDNLTGTMIEVDPKKMLDAYNKKAKTKANSVFDILSVTYHATVISVIDKGKTKERITEDLKWQRNTFLHAYLRNVAEEKNIPLTDNEKNQLPPPKPETTAEKMQVRVNTGKAAKQEGKGKTYSNNDIISSEDTKQKINRANAIFNKDLVLKGANTNNLTLTNATYNGKIVVDHKTKYSSDFKNVVSANHDKIVTALPIGASKAETTFSVIKNQVNIGESTLAAATFVANFLNEYEKVKKDDDFKFGPTRLWRNTFGDSYFDDQLKKNKGTDEEKAQLIIEHARAEGEGSKTWKAMKNLVANHAQTLKDQKVVETIDTVTEHILINPRGDDDHDDIGPATVPTRSSDWLVVSHKVEPASTDEIAARDAIAKGKGAIAKLVAPPEIGAPSEAILLYRTEILSAQEIDFSTAKSAFYQAHLQMESDADPNSPQLIDTTNDFTKTEEQFNARVKEIIETLARAEQAAALLKEISELTDKTQEILGKIKGLSTQISKKTDEKIAVNHNEIRLANEAATKTNIDLTQKIAALEKLAPEKAATLKQTAITIQADIQAALTTLNSVALANAKMVLDQALVTPLEESTHLLGRGAKTKEDRTELADELVQAYHCVKDHDKAATEKYDGILKNEIYPHFLQYVVHDEKRSLASNGEQVDFFRYGCVESLGKESQTMPSMLLALSVHRTEGKSAQFGLIQPTMPFDKQFIQICQKEWATMPLAQLANAGCVDVAIAKTVAKKMEAHPGSVSEADRTRLEKEYYLGELLKAGKFEEAQHEAAAIKMAFPKINSLNTLHQILNEAVNKLIEDEVISRMLPIAKDIANPENAGFTDIERLTKYSSIATGLKEEFNKTSADLKSIFDAVGLSNHDTCYMRFSNVSSAACNGIPITFALRAIADKASQNQTPDPALVATVEACATKPFHWIGAGDKDNKQWIETGRPFNSKNQLAINAGSSSSAELCTTARATANAAVSIADYAIDQSLSSKSADPKNLASLKHSACHAADASEAIQNAVQGVFAYDKFALAQNESKTGLLSKTNEAAVIGEDKKYAAKNRIGGLNECEIKELNLKREDGKTPYPIMNPEGSNLLNTTFIKYLLANELQAKLTQIKSVLETAPDKETVQNCFDSVTNALEKISKTLEKIGEKGKSFDSLIETTKTKMLSARETWENKMAGVTPEHGTSFQNS